MKKRNKRLIFSLGISEIFLLFISSFAIAFILSDNLTSAQAGLPTQTPGLGSKTIDFNQLIKTNPEAAWSTNPQTGEISKDSLGTGFYNSAFPGFAQNIPNTQANLGFYKLPAVGTGATSFFTAHLIEGVFWGGVLALGIKYIGPMLGLSEEASNAAALAAFGGIVAGKAAYGLFGTATPGVSSGGLLGSGLGPWGATGIGVLVAVAIFVLTYKSEKKKLVNFQCLPYEPPLGGADCEKCNKDPFRPCSEYRCRALGQACQLLNPGTGQEKCAWVNPKDVNSPTIQPWIDVLKPFNLKYIPDNTIRPPNRGVKIVNEGGSCLRPYTPLEFGITTNEPSQCKVDYIMKNKLDEMEFFFGGSNYYLYNHTQKMKLPGPDNSSAGALAPELENNGIFGLFVRCRDANGNENVDAFVFNFCVDPSPDTTPPIIEGTNIVNNGFIGKKTESVPIEVYVNEPAECKWSRISKPYEDMENTMGCATQTYQINANLNYACTGNLSITDKGKGSENKFYFRCKDQPNKPESERNVMVQSKELTLRGSDELNILGIEPNGTIMGNTTTVPVNLIVKTGNGAEEGKATCYFSATGKKDTYITMFETNNYIHKQSLDLVKGNYEYFFRCIDAAGNTDEDKTSFSVFVDEDMPKVTRAYRDTDALKIVTNENARCVYNLKDCNYEIKDAMANGLSLLYSNPSIQNNHFAEWKENTVYHIKCEDFYGNKPVGTECSIIVKSVDLK